MFLLRLSDPCLILHFASQSLLVSVMFRCLPQNVELVPISRLVVIHWISSPPYLSVYKRVEEMNGLSEIWISELLSSSMCDSFSGEWLAVETTVVHCAAPALTLSGLTDRNRVLPNRATHTKHFTQVFPLIQAPVFNHYSCPRFSTMLNTKQSNCMS